MPTAKPYPFFIEDHGTYEEPDPWVFVDFGRTTAVWPTSILDRIIATAQAAQAQLPPQRRR